MPQYFSKVISGIVICASLLSSSACLGKNQYLSPQTNSDSVLLVKTEAELETLLSESWQVYRQQFIQQDGRVIDFEAGDRTVSEGQAYAMLRAVLIDDRDTFDRTLNWAESNLRRSDGDKMIDQLWAWKWGKLASGEWGLIDINFATDADIDAAFALVLAAEQWQDDRYLELARLKLADIWKYSTVDADGDRYLLPGPKAAFQTAETIYLNPSYLAPYAFRVFAEVDPSHDWLKLVDTSYQILEDSASLSALGLPGDWVALNLTTGEFEAVPLESLLKNQYGFDAYRVWWRIAWDAALFDSSQAQQYLLTYLRPLQDLWLTEQFIPAEFDLAGNPLVSYDTIAQYSMLYSGFRAVNPMIANDIYYRQIAPEYQSGIWDNPSAYYSQNLVWLGIFPPADIKALLE